MSTSLRVAALAVAVSFTIGCDFFSLDDDDSSKGGSGGQPEMGGTAGVGGTITTLGGTGGSALGGTGGSAMAGTSTSSGGAGTGGTGGAGASGGMAGASVAGMAGGASMAMGGMAGGAGVAMGGMAGGAGMAGSASGAGGGGTVTCESLGAEEHNGHCYLLVTNGASWQSAKSACMDKGAHLVTISSEAPLTQDDFDAENDYVFNELGGSKDTWIGLSDGHTDKESATDGEFKWVNDEAVTLDNWNDNEPNHYMKDCMDGSDCWEHCVFIMMDPAGKWNDELCEMSKQYVCEWDMSG